MRTPLTYVVVLQILEQRDFPDGRARRALLVLEPDLLQRHQIVRQTGLAFEDRCVSALEQRAGVKVSTALLCGFRLYLSKFVELRVCVHAAKSDLGQRLPSTRSRQRTVQRRGHRLFLDKVLWKFQIRGQRQAFVDFFLIGELSGLLSHDHAGSSPLSSVGRTDHIRL